MWKSSALWGEKKSLYEHTRIQVCEKGSTRENSRLARADHVRDGLLACLERRGERGHEEHGEGVEEGHELHVGSCSKGIGC